MDITNSTSFEVIAFGWHTDRGYGDDVSIQPGETKEVNGPFIGEMGGGDCHILIEGEINCHEGPDDENGFQVLEGAQLSLAAGDKGITVRHHSEDRQIVPPDEQ